MKWGALLVAAIWLTGCCAGPQYALFNYDSRTEMEHLQRFALVAPILSDTSAWAYGTPATAIETRTDAYRPDATREQERVVGAPADAPGDLGRALAAAGEVMRELGYVPAGEEADLVVLVALSTYDDGRLARVAVHIGTELDGRFDPYRISLSATVPEEDACPATAEELVRELVSVLPEWEEAEAQEP